MDAQNDISNWIASIPKITRWWFFAFFLIPLATRLGLVSPIHLVLFSEQVFSGFQVSEKQGLAVSSVLGWDLLFARGGTRLVVSYIMWPVFGRVDISCEVKSLLPSNLFLQT